MKFKCIIQQEKQLEDNGIEGNKSLDRQLETRNIWRMKNDVRYLEKEHGSNYRSVQLSYEEAKLHENESGDISEEDKGKLRTEDIDGDLNTKTHTHTDNKNLDYAKLASKWGYYIDGKPNEKRAKELYEEKRKQNPNKNEKEIIELVSEDLEKELHHSREER